MEEKQQWLSIAAVVLVIAGLGFFLYKQSKNVPPETPPEISQEEQQAQEKGQAVADRLNMQVPEGADRITLKPVNGAEAAGLVSRLLEDDTYKISVAADLANPAVGQYYEAFAVNSADEKITLGRLRQAKGGWLLDTSISQEKGEYNKIVISRETVNKPEASEEILAAEFN